MEFYGISVSELVLWRYVISPLPAQVLADRLLVKVYVPEVE